MEDTKNDSFLYSEFSPQHWMLLAFDYDRIATAVIGTAPR